MKIKMCGPALAWPGWVSIVLIKEEGGDWHSNWNKGGDCENNGEK